MKKNLFANKQSRQMWVNSEKVARKMQKSGLRFNRKTAK